MKRIDLKEVEHNIKMGSICEYIKPNIKEDCIFYSDGIAIGFYMKKMPKKMIQLSEIANVEFLTKRVPKSNMRRSTFHSKEEYIRAKGNSDSKVIVDQFSTIIGSIPPKAQFKRPYPNRSSVHAVKSAQTFIKAMYLLAIESENLIKKILPEQYNNQLELLKDVPKEWRFANLFTSSISNFNIAAQYHRDNGNIKGAVNVIITKRQDSKGGDLNLPDYDATINQCNNSILVYPAWKNMHGVTPIIPSHDKGYRNSLIFYPLKAFKGI
jgi:hypothetical protein